MKVGDKLWFVPGYRKALFMKAVELEPQRLKTLADTYLGGVK